MLWDIITDHTTHTSNRVYSSWICPRSHCQQHVCCISKYIYVELRPKEAKSKSQKEPPCRMHTKDCSSTTASKRKEGKRREERRDNTWKRRGFSMTRARSRGDSTLSTSRKTVPSSQQSMRLRFGSQVTVIRQGCDHSRSFQGRAQKRDRDSHRAVNCRYF